MRRLPQVRSGEKRATVSAFATLFGLVAGHTLLETARDALFLARLPPSRLPWMYLALAALGFVTAKRAPRGTRPRAVRLLLAVGAAVTGGLAIAATHPSPVLAYVLYVWTSLYAAHVSATVWRTLGTRFHIAEARRLYGLIGAGSVSGALAGALAARAMTTSLSARALLWGGAAAFLLTILPALGLEGGAGAGLIGDATDEGRRPDATLTPYAKRVLWLALGSSVTLTIVDYLFKSTIARTVAVDDLARTFASVAAATSALALLMQLFVAGPLLRAVGVQRALFVFPSLLAASLAGMAAFAGVLPALAMRLSDGTLRHSLHRTTTELLRVPLAIKDRLRLEPLLDAVGVRGGAALASLGILALHAAGAERSLLLVAGATTAVWMVLVASLRGSYLALFRDALQENAFALHEKLPELDLDTLETLTGALGSPNEDEVLGALELLGEQQRQRAVPTIILYHPAPKVLQTALEIFVRTDRQDALPLVEAHLLLHPRLEIRTAALRAHAALAKTDDVLRAHASSSAPEMRVTALACLAARQDATPDVLASLLHAADAESPHVVRLSLARALGWRASPDLEPVLRALAKSDEIDILEQVARGAAALPPAAALDILVPLLAVSRVRTAIRAALAALGEGAVEPLASMLADDALPLGTRLALPRAMAEAAPRASAALLLRALVLGGHPGNVRYRILRALGFLRRRDPDLSLDVTLLERAAQDATAAALDCLEWRTRLEREATRDPSVATPSRTLVVSLLLDKEAHAVTRLFRVLALMHPEEDLERIHRGVTSKDPKARAGARELLEATLVPGLRAVTLALVDDAPPAERLRLAGRRVDASAPTLLATMAARGGTLGTLATHHRIELERRAMASPASAATTGGADV